MSAMDKAAKKAKASVDYRPGTPTTNCGACSMYTEKGSGNGVCSLVAGGIQARYVCNEFQRRASKTGVAPMEKGMSVQFKPGASHPLAMKAKGVGTVAEVHAIGDTMHFVDVEFAPGVTALGIDYKQLCVVVKPVEEISAKASLVEAMLKAGRRHGKGDLEHLQTAHDHVAALVDGMHCVNKADEYMASAEGQDLLKRNARHAKVDLERIKAAHDALLDTGAVCKGY